MKKLRIFLPIFLIIITIAWVTPAFAEWSIQQVNPGTGIVKGNYAAFGMTFTSDGSAMAATDIIARIANATLKSNVQGKTLYKIGVSPGSGGVAPNAAFDITVTNDWDMIIYAGTSISHSAESWPDIFVSMAVYPPVLNEFNLAIGDIGDSGDQVTLYFYFWVD